MRGVLDDHEAIALGNVGEEVHLARDARIMHDADGARARRDCTLYQRLVEVQRVGPDVHEHGGRATQHERIRRGDERVGRHDDFVPGPDVREHGRHFQRRRARVAEQRPPAPDRLLQPFTTLRCKRPVSREMGARQRLRDVGELLAKDRRAVERYGPLWHGNSRVTRLEVAERYEGLGACPSKWRA